MSETPRPNRRWQKLGRRQLLALGVTGTAAGGLGLGLGFFGGQRFERRQMRVPPREQPFSPNVFLAIDHDGTTTIWVTRSEMGQGVSTALPMIVADALDADWRAVRIELAPASQTYGYQGTMASASVRGMYDELREAGGLARAMLLEAGAGVFEVDVAQCDTRLGGVVHRASGRTIGYGELTSLAAALEVPSAPALREGHRLIGRPTRRLDARDKAEGRAIYGIDVRLPGLRFASIERARGLGGSVGDVAEAAARAVHGVLDVVRLDSGVAVIAEHTHAAFAGRRALAADHRAGPNGRLASADVAERLRDATRAEGAEVHVEGDAAAALAGAARRLEATFEVPYLAHQCMEPINATARFANGAWEVWAPTQDPMGVREAVAELAGVGLEQCTVHVTLLGGGFGRRTVPQEFREVVELARRTSPHPVQLVWMREDDIQHDYYRCAAAHRFEVGLDAAGEIVAWRNHVATPTHAGGDAAAGRVDEYAVDGAARPPYRLGAVEVRWTDVASPIPTGIWRSVGHSYNAFAVEAMLDEVARATERDPLELRLALLPEGARHRAVLERVARMCAWTTPPAEGRARGLAVHECFGSVCAQVAELSLEDGQPRVHRVWAAVECGLVINPLGVQAQIMGGIVFGLSAALHGGIDVERGRVRQSNFHDALVLRMDECPAIEVEVLPGSGAPAGIGEVGVPMIAPAVASALARLRGEPVRVLPILGRS